MSATLHAMIVEDEAPAAEKLQRYLQRYDASIQIAGICSSVEEAAAWIKVHQGEVDLFFFDIQLTDGKSFEIFSKVQITKPVIFTTAYNEYALDAFRSNGIAYLLKPITFDDLQQAMDKFRQFTQHHVIGPEKLASLEAKPDASISYKGRFMVKVGDHIRSVTADQIAFFYADGRDVYLVTRQPRKFIIDFTLEQLEEILDPAQFFRINRTFIVHIQAIQEALVYSNSRLRLTTQPPWEEEMIVSREKVNEFKNWLDGQHG